jgi:hypothetical protein
MSSNGKEARSALLIRCTAEEAAAIRKAAKLERRTVSAYVLRAVMNRMSIQRRIESGVNLPEETKRDSQGPNGNGKIGADLKRDVAHSAV